MAELEITDLMVTIVESSVTQGKIIINKLSKLGVQKVQYYPDGKIGLEFIEKFKPNLVISAMYLSDMTAVDLVLTIRKTPAIEDVSFLLITTENAFDAIDPVRQAGAVAVLSKPFELKDLESALYATKDLLTIDEDFIDQFAWEDLSVLVVDDSKLAQKMVCKLLTNIGISKIDLANNGKEGAEAIGKNLYDLVITDFNMPEMDGGELVAYIRNKSNQQAVPIMMITSENDDATLSAVSKAGVSGICDKPFEPHVFKEMILSFFVK